MQFASALTKLHLPPCCSLCMPSIHSFPCQSCILLPFDLMTTPSLHYHTPPPCRGISSSYLCFLFFSHLWYKCVYPQPPFLSASYSFSLFPHSYFLPSPFSSPIRTPTQPPFSLPVCNDKFCGSRAGCVNVKPFPAMIMFITNCASRCPWINTNWRSTLQR